MNKKGFTLVELLAVITILAVIVVTAAPEISKEVKKSEEENKNIINEKIENAAHIYAAKYYASDLINGNAISFSLNDLEQDGLLELKDKCENEKDNNISISDGDYDYSQLDNCYTE